MNDTINPGDQIGDAIALGKTVSIPTLEKHYKHFSFVHGLEFHIEKNDGEWHSMLGRREMFNLHAPTVFGEQRVSIDVSGIKYALANRKMHFTMHEGLLNQTWADYVFKCGGCEEQGIDRLKPSDLRRPGILVLWDSTGNQTMIDGNHRLVRRWREKMTTFQYALVLAPDLFRNGFIVPEGDEYKFLKNASNVHAKV